MYDYDGERRRRKESRQEASDVDGGEEEEEEGRKEMGRCSKTNSANTTSVLQTFSVG